MSFIPDITMEEVRSTIAFRGNNENESCIPKESNIPLLQEQGTLSLCRILNQGNIAYLADEVGMGKTYQALGVITMLIKHNPSAKILIIAPKSNVQDNWCNDFNIFKAHNLNKQHILKFKNKISIRRYARIYEFAEAMIKGEVANISVLRLTAFSSGVKGICKPIDNKYSLKELTDLLKDKGYRIQEEVQQDRKLEPRQAAYYYGYAINHVLPEFDLVIIDEAQNIRNINQATTLFNAMLGLKRNMDVIDPFPERQLKFKSKVKKVLLLSATPAHRKRRDICSQLAYFMKKEVEEGQLNHEYLEQFMIRRLRTYEGRTKYDCRENEPIDISEHMTAAQKLFIALIQKRLADKLSEAGRDNKNIYKIGFLETFESYNASETTNSKNEEEEDEKKEFENGTESKKEGTSAPDKQVLQEIAQSFDKSMKGSKMAYPPHPKLDFMNQQLQQSTQEEDELVLPEKALVFVRRIASVNELTYRLQKQYEDIIFTYWQRRLKKIGKQITSFERLQQYFEENYLRSEEKQIDDGEADLLNDEDNEISKEEQLIEEIKEESDKINKKSYLLDWLALKTTRKLADGTKISKKDYEYTAVSRFKLSLLDNHQRSFVFNENYFLTLCKNANLSVSKWMKKIVTNTFTQRINNYVEVYDSIYIKDKKRHTYKNTNLAYLIYYLSIEQLAKEGILEDVDEFLRQYKTYYEIPKEPIIVVEGKLKKERIIKILKRKSIWNVVQEDKEKRYAFLEEWQDEYNFKKRELIKIWATKYMKASEMILELLYCFIQDNQRFVEDFSKKVLLNNQQNGTQRILELIQNYVYVKRELMPDEEVYKNLKYYKYNPTVLDEQRQVVGAVGGSEHSAKIKRFNTPFYPDIIICTDIFKEGINMHLFCNKVYHYGLAWSPGDLEQRIGRVDRYFSKTHRQIIKGQKAKVQVIYPYLGKTIDETQLKKVLRFKIEIDPLMDSTGDMNREINTDIIDCVSIKELAQYKPEKETDSPFSGKRYWDDSSI